MIYDEKKMGEKDPLAWEAHTGPLRLFRTLTF